MNAEENTELQRLLDDYAAWRNQFHSSETASIEEDFAFNAMLGYADVIAEFCLAHRPALRDAPDPATEAKQT